MDIESGVIRAQIILMNIQADIRRKALARYSAALIAERRKERGDDKS